ncbi:HpcH/HpaI aldolase/citrate lyase family protein [Paracoccus sediminicola]|uniref:HpcH/HpaI aldolase/citrate lyase family protein n=1 Tax=Paracoccus sediminicola TaxID=3017783 RepID=UPI0022F022BB|nr:CoA ester lyase [Paracoccus sediminicola]WBU58793.1 CoA ester lyase [Paracoccus sediminicola]
MKNTTRPKRLRRCQLSVPGSSEKMMRKAAGMDLDYVFLDLEDAVAPNRKKEARGMVVEALNTLDFGRTTRCVRINDTGTPYCYGDIIEVVTGARENVDVIMLTKPFTPADLLFVDKLLSQLEADLGLTKKIGLECLIEEVEAMVAVNEIASCTPRLEALIFGIGDYSASQGVPFAEIEGKGDYPADIWHYQRHRLIMACRANGIDAVDGPFPDFTDADQFRIECQRAQMLGAVGKWAIHPSQVTIAQEVFSPAQDDVDRAREIKALYDEALDKGLGAVTYEGKMIDIAVVRLLQNTIDMADLIGM